MPSNNNIPVISNNYIHPSQTTNRVSNNSYFPSLTHVVNTTITFSPTTLIQENTWNGRWSDQFLLIPFSQTETQRSINEYFPEVISQADDMEMFARRHPEIKSPKDLGVYKGSSGKTITKELQEELKRGRAYHSIGAAEGSCGPCSALMIKLMLEGKPFNEAIRTLEKSGREMSIRSKIYSDAGFGESYFSERTGASSNEADILLLSFLGLEVVSEKKRGLVSEDNDNFLNLAKQMAPGEVADYQIIFNKWSTTGVKGCHGTVLARLDENSFAFFDPNFGIFLISIDQIKKFMPRFLREHYNNDVLDQHLRIIKPSGQTDTQTGLIKSTKQLGIEEVQKNKLRISQSKFHLLPRPIAVANYQATAEQSNPHSKKTALAEFYIPRKLTFDQQKSLNQLSSEFDLKANLKTTGDLIQAIEQRYGVNVFNQTKTNWPSDLWEISKALKEITDDKTPHQHNSFLPSFSSSTRTMTKPISTPSIPLTPPVLSANVHVIKENQNNSNNKIITHSMNHNLYTSFQKPSVPQATDFSRNIPTVAPSVSSVNLNNLSYQKEIWQTIEPWSMYFRETEKLLAFIKNKGGQKTGEEITLKFAHFFKWSFLTADEVRTVKEYLLSQPLLPQNLPQQISPSITPVSPSLENQILKIEEPRIIQQPLPSITKGSYSIQTAYIATKNSEIYHEILHLKQKDKLLAFIKEKFGEQIKKEVEAKFSRAFRFNSLLNIELEKISDFLKQY